MIRMLVVNDDTSVLERVQTVLRGVNGVTVVGAALGRAEAAELTARVDPDVVLALRSRHGTRRILSAVSYHAEMHRRNAERSTRELSLLTRREFDVIRALCVGAATNMDIAVRLGVSTGTVKGHLARITEKLGLRTRTELVAFAFRSGLVR